MTNDQQLNQRIIDALKAKFGQRRATCALCAHDQWQIANRFVVLPASKNAHGIVLGGETYPLVPLICQNCGNTHLLNLFLLGFTQDDINALGYFS